MVAFHDPTAHAAAAHDALRGLAHATRDVDDPREIYDVLGLLSTAVASLEQSLHQLGDSMTGQRGTARGSTVTSERGEPPRARFRGSCIARPRS